MCSYTILAALQITALLANFGIVNSRNFYITPTLTDRCPEEPCLTLSQFSADATSYVSSGNTILLFQPGTHFLSSTLAIFNTDKFSMHPLSTTFNVTIFCEQSGGFDFRNSEQILVTNIEFVGCDGNNVSRVRKFVIENSIFFGRENGKTYLFFIGASRVYVIGSNFTGVNGEGVIRLAYGAIAEVGKCKFTNNVGGVIILFEAGIYVTNTLFYNNSLENLDEAGAAIYALHSKVIIHESNFSCNSASGSGAIHAVEHTTISIHKCLFHKNKAQNMGGAFSVFIRSTALIRDTVFSENIAKRGGALVVYKEVTTIIKDSLFINNTAVTGGVIYAYMNSHFTTSNTKIDGNKASSAVVFVLGSTAVFSNRTMHSNNVGSLLVVNSKLNISGNSTFMNNRYSSTTVNDATDININEGGALTAFQSEITIDGICSLSNNHAKIGGAVNTIQSKVHVLGELAVSNNTAEDSGGGLYLSRSELTCEMYSRINLTGNRACGNGGGIHAVGSFISIDFSVHPWGTTPSIIHYQYLGSLVQFTENKAEKGGGIYLEEEAKIYILKNEKHLLSSNNSDRIPPMIYVLIFSDNSANYGGAVYVSDGSNFGTCASTSYEDHSTSNGCFLQTLALHLRRSSKLNLVNTKFERNIATISGSTLFGGLLDRCTANPFAEVFYKFYDDTQALSIDGLSYLQNISTFQDGLESISSFPVRLCFCRDEQPDCFYQPPPVRVMKGENFTLSLVAVDQLNKTISNSSIHSYLRSYEGTLDTDQLLQSTGEGCTKLTFAAFSLQAFEELIMYPEGPCGNVEMSQLKKSIEFLPCTCPIGFEQDLTEKAKCKCKCDSRLHPYITECNDKNGMLLREGDFWINYVNDSNGFVIYPHCPRDYCQSSSSSISINLNIANGSDAQCTHNRSGVLCGACRSGLSLSLDGMNCVVCPRNWPLKFFVIIVSAILAGILLVALVLVLNLTVAIGALNGIFFYANIVNINKNLLFPFPTPNYVTVFISWLNLDIGFDTCFFEGMDAYSKTWLQLTFPVYLFFLVVVVIVLSEKSQRFAHLIGKRDPVATLATLILLSYDKLFQTAIQVFSFAVMDYPSGSREVVWFTDANVKYFRGKHIPLFLTALFILAICILYAVLLFSWQWFLRCPDKKCLRWIRNQKLHLFLKSYHTPYTIKCRYWTGLLILVRAALSFSTAVNMSNDPGLNLLLFGVVMIFLIILVGQCSPVYESSVIEFIEVTVYANMTFFFAFSSYFLQVRKHQTIAAYISGTVAIIQFLFVLFHHLYAAFLSKKKLIVKFKKVFNQRGNDEMIDYPPLDDNARNSHANNPYTYGSSSQMVRSDEATENSPLITASSVYPSY